MALVKMVVDRVNKVVALVKRVVEIACPNEKIGCVCAIAFIESLQHQKNMALAS
jgi:hypothetical protein